MLASEVHPFAKTGGLADVVGALPQALTALGHEVRIGMPLYGSVDRRRFRLQPIQGVVTVAVGDRTWPCRIWTAPLPATTLPVYFIEQPELFGRAHVYQLDGRDDPDNLLRFSVFCQAALALIPHLRWQPQVLHAHDWQTALAVAHLAFGAVARAPAFSSISTVFTIHNLAYQGLFPREQWPLTGLPESTFRIDRLEFYGQINCLKGGLVGADLLTTVSPTYSQEIQTKEFGCGLEGVLQTRRGRLTGILNGIDPQEWNPQTDPHLPAHFSADRLAGKSICKLTLQQRQNLPTRHDVLIGMIQRLVDQKGIDVFLDALPALMALPIQVVVLGTGDPRYHEQLTQAQQRYADRLSVTLAFDNGLAHLIEAGADAFLMASRFEPCGLNQMYSMRYGTVPMVRRVGGLADTVVDLQARELATGLVFESADPASLTEAVRRAVVAFRDQRVWRALMQQGMRQDWSWDRSARRYVEVYRQAMATRHGQGVG